MFSGYEVFSKEELILKITELEELNQYYIEHQIKSDAIINDLKENISFLESENDALKKRLIKRDNPGRPSLDNEIVEQISKLKDRGFTTREIAERLGISVGSVTKYNPYYLSRK